MIRRLLWYSLLFLPSLGLAVEPVSVSQFGGINTDDSPLVLQNGQTPDSENVWTDEGPGLQGRKGHVLFSTETSKALWEFPLSNGTRYLITHNPTTNELKATTGGSNFQTLVSTVAATIKTVGTVLGDRFYFSNTTDGLKYWDGTSVTVASAAMTVDKLVTWKGRLVAAGKSGSERTIFLSEFLDGTNFTLATTPVDTDPAQITVSGALDENIQALYSSFQDKLIWFKSNSFGGIFGSRRSTFASRVYSDDVGVSDPETIQDCDGLLRWLGLRREVWEFDGSTYRKISEDVDNLFDTIEQGDTLARSKTQTTQAEFGAGTMSNPSVGLSTTVIVGSVLLSTQSATTVDTDTSSDDFGQGTLTQVSTDSAGQVRLAFNGSATSKESCTPSGNPGTTGCSAPYYAVSQQFDADSGFCLSQITVKVQRYGSPGNYRVYVTNNSADEPTTTIDSTDITGTASITTASSGELKTYSFNDKCVDSGGTYWVQIVPLGTCDSSNRLIFQQGNASALGCETGFYGSNDTNVKTLDLGTYFDITGRPLHTSGNIVSRAFDVGFTTHTWFWNWAELTATEIKPGSTDISYQTQTSSSSTGGWEELVPVVNTGITTSTVQRYIRYKASLTGTTSESPELRDIKIDISEQRKSSGTFTSQVLDAGANVSQWNPLSISDVPGDGSIVYEINFSTINDIDQFDASSWTIVQSGSIPDFGTDARYMALRGTFTITNATQAPSLDSFTFNWIEGSSLDAVSVYSNQRYWLGVSISSTANNTALVYDKTGQWQKVTGTHAHIDAATTYRTALHFGNTNGIYQGETTYSDNGSDITGFYRSKAYAPSGPDKLSLYNYLYLTTDESDATLSTSYQINRNGTDYTLGAVQMNATNGLQNFKIPFYQTEVQQSKYVDFKWSVTGSSFWRLNNANLYYEPGRVTD